MSKLNGVMEFANKEYGKGTVISGHELKRDPPRVPFGVFATDFASGGGLPVWGSTCLWGGESGGKTSLAINAVAAASMLCFRCFKYLQFCECSQNAVKLKSFWGDAEGTFDRDWASSIGAGPDEYYFALADYGEMYINITDKALQADDCGLVVVDSLAALTPVAEFDAASEDQQIGMQARMISRAVRVLKQRVIRERKRGHPISLLFTNQMRTKIGVMFGDPSTMPGGHALRHEFSLLLRCNKKALSDGDKKKYQAKGSDFASRHSFSIKKKKVLTLHGMGEYLRLSKDMNSLDMTAGQIDDFATVMAYAKKYGVVRQDGGWVYDGERYKRQLDIAELWKEDKMQYLNAQMLIIDRAKERLGGEDAS